MFKESEKNKQMNLFSSPHTYLSGSAGKFYSNPLSWHNQFREQVVARVDDPIQLELDFNFVKDGK